MALFLGIDMGTSYFKAALFNEQGKLKGLGRKALLKSREHRRCELQLPVFWATLRECIYTALHSAGAKSDDIEAISYSSQANSFLLVDGSGNALTPIIMWTDTRVEVLDPSLQELSEAEEFAETTGIGSLLSPQTLLSKLLWFRKHEARFWKNARKAMTISDYLTFELTGEAVSDFSTLSLTGLLDARAGRWWTRVLQTTGLPPTLLSPPERTGTPVGKLTKEGAEKLGLSAITGYCLGGLDHHMAALGVGMYKGNDISESTGTVLAAVRYDNAYLPKQNIFIAPGLDNSHFFSLSYSENGARPLEWYQQNFAPAFSIPELLQMAASVRPGSDGLLAKPSVSEYNDLEGFINKKSSHTDAHYIRAILESTAISLKDIVDKLIDKNVYERIAATGGGAASNIWTQIKADILGKQFMIPLCNEAACMGAAMLAAKSIGHFSSIEEAGNIWVREKETIQPNGLNHNWYSQWIQQQQLNPV